MTFKPGTSVQLAGRAEQFYSIIADGKELITGDNYGPLVVPELKDGNVKVAFKSDLVRFIDTFSGCKNLTSIPEDLFANNPNVIGFGYTGDELACDVIVNDAASWEDSDIFITGGVFQECTSLTAIPENLFANNRKVRVFGNVFICCTGLTSIPENLFANNTEVDVFSGVFFGCTGLTSIPENLFANNRKVRYFGQATVGYIEVLYFGVAVIGMFASCTGLTSIPENLFANNTEVNEFNITFYMCDTLASIPTGLFDNNRRVTEFRGIFQDCDALTGESPYTMIGDKKVHLYERKNYPEHFTTPSADGGFSGCVGLSDYAQIPSDWK